MIQRPESKLVSYYFQTRLETEFDEHIWVDFSKAVSPLSKEIAPEFPVQHPFLWID